MAMPFKIKHLNEFRLPDYPDAPLQLNRSPLAIIDIDDQSTNDTDQSTPTSDNDTNTTLTTHTGLATALYNWHPTALTAFLDLDAWFSLTWTVSFQHGTPDESNIEIGRVGNQITFGSLGDGGKDWILMLTYNIVLEGKNRGAWVPNPKECMEGERDVTDVGKIEMLSLCFVRRLLDGRVWETGKKVKHTFHSEYAPMDIWGDGILMNPHWLYKSLDLSKCTTCDILSSDKNVLKRCGKCGTATYCSGECQRRDWKVHKFVCGLGLEERGQMLKVSEKGGLVGWDEGRMYAEEGSGEESANPNFATEWVLKRTRKN